MRFAWGDRYGPMTNFSTWSSKRLWVQSSHRCRFDTEFDTYRVNVPVDLWEERRVDAMSSVVIRLIGQVGLCKTVSLVESPNRGPHIDKRFPYHGPRVRGLGTCWIPSWMDSDGKIWTPDRTSNWDAIFVPTKPMCLWLRGKKLHGDRTKGLVEEIRFCLQEQNLISRKPLLCFATPHQHRLQGLTLSLHISHNSKRYCTIQTRLDVPSPC